MSDLLWFWLACYGLCWSILHLTRAARFGLWLMRGEH